MGSRRNQRIRNEIRTKEIKRETHYNKMQEKHLKKYVERNQKQKKK